MKNEMPSGISFFELAEKSSGAGATKLPACSLVSGSDAMESRGYGWCFAHWFSPYGVAFCKPVMEDTMYERLDAYPYYIDQEMLALFREINGIG
ncbi:MAG: hypothetical protein IJB59_09225 [Oscillospiraceae bacterium]|nr:hypothetical protein [Oscillospiraceae bacterium]